MPKARGSKSVTEAVKGSEMDLLLSLQDELAQSLADGVPPAYKTQMVRELRNLRRDIETLKAVQTEGDDVSQAAATPDAPWTV
jgi:hypothetical protein